jgi:hypothetical protein
MYEPSTVFIEPVQYVSLSFSLPLFSTLRNV